MGIAGVFIGLAGCSPGPEAGAARVGAPAGASASSAAAATSGAVSGGEDAVTANGFPQATGGTAFEADPSGQGLSESTTGVVGVGHLPPF